MFFTGDPQSGHQDFMNLIWQAEKPARL
jgi:hypothetical protein